MLILRKTNKAVQRLNAWPIGGFICGERVDPCNDLIATKEIELGTTPS